MTSDGAAFTNQPVDAGDLPRLEPEPFVPLDPALIRLRTIGALIALVVVTSAVTVAVVLTASPRMAIFGAVLIVFVAGIGFLQRLEVRNMCYLVREHDLSFQRGIISRSVATVPFARVQHVSIERGPLDRRFGLATLQLRTAGGQVAITGLRADEAERLKLLVSDRAAQIAEAEIDTDAG